MAGGRQQEVIEAKGTGGREERQDKTNMNMKTERACGREEDTEEEGWEEANIFTLILISPEADRIAAEGDTSWLRGNYQYCFCSTLMFLLLCVV